MREQALGDELLGTTKNGIGPAYADKANRVGLRMQDLLNAESFAVKLRAAVAEKNAFLTSIYGAKRIDAEELIERYLTTVVLKWRLTWPTALRFSTRRSTPASTCCWKEHRPLS